MARDLASLRARLRTDLTATALESMPPGAPGKPSILSDSRNPGFRARRQGSGAPVLEMRYRVAGERRTAKLGAYRRHPNDISGVPPWTVQEALARYHETLDALARKQDPKAVQAARHEADERRLNSALDAYEQSLANRQVVKRGEVMSLLRRELEKPLGDVPLAQITRAVLTKRFAKVEDSGRPGTAKELRTRAGVFLGWCVNEGLLHASPLDSYRRERKTRAQRLDRPGRALADAELAPFWQAACAAKPAFGAYLLTLLLCGQRRTETALMRWEDVDLEAGEWSIPAAVTKTGKAHRVPLPRLVRAILRTLPQRGELVFAGRGGKPLTGWSKRLVPVYAATAAAGMAPWTPHDLRRTMRSGLSELKVERNISELMLNHALSAELEATYDRAELWAQRRRAARRWALRVLRARRA